MDKEYIFRLNDIFHTVQGEGRYAGTRALFIRLPHCNYNCTWCDTEYDSINHKLTKSELREFILQEKTQFFVITGGEPSINKQLSHLADTIKDVLPDSVIAIETNGSFYPEYIIDIDHVTISPKSFTNNKFKPFYFDPKYLTDEVTTLDWKYVVDDDFDFSTLNLHYERDLKPNEMFYLSPEYNKMNINVERILEYMKNDPKWRLNLQTHKWIGVK